MHNAALEQVGLTEWRYQLLPVPPELFAETVAALPGAGFRGANVTIPHKRAALALADRATPRAEAIGAANTLLFGADGTDADNTDAPALISLLPFDVSGASAVVLGAGGSARAAVWALIDLGAGEVRSWNRSPERSRALADELGAMPVTDVAAADVLVNCTPAGLDDLPIGEAQLVDYRCVVDFAYGVQETRLVQAARARGIPAVDGIELLVAQGALSFEQFTGRAAPRGTMRAAAGAPLSCGPP